jgi:hypothetical protein
MGAKRLPAGIDFKKSHPHVPFVTSFVQPRYGFFLLTQPVVNQCDTGRRDVMGTGFQLVQNCLPFRGIASHCFNMTCEEHKRQSVATWQSCKLVRCFRGANCSVLRTIRLSSRSSSLCSFVSSLDDPTMSMNRTCAISSRISGFNSDIRPDHVVNQKISNSQRRRPNKENATGRVDLLTTSESFRSCPTAADDK